MEFQAGIPDATLLSLLPGSRMQEVKRMLPIFGGVLDILKDNMHDLTAIIPTVSNKQLTRTVESVVRRWNVPVVVLPGASEREKYNAFAASVAGLCTSGTAVLQMQIARLPCVVCYRANIVTEWLIQHRTKLKYISLPNILLDSPVIPEALFSGCTSEHLALLLRQLLEDKSLQQQQAEASSKVLRMLAPIEPQAAIVKSSSSGNTGDIFDLSKPSMEAARTILKLLDFSEQK